MNLRSAIFTGIVCAVVAFPVMSQTGQTAPSGTTKPRKAPATAASTDGKVHDGQKVFEQNCGRCHNPPQGFSTSISATVTRHMRARANLSPQDLEALLRFLNP